MAIIAGGQELVVEYLGSKVAHLQPYKKEFINSIV